MAELGFLVVLLSVVRPLEQNLGAVIQFVSLIHTSETQKNSQETIWCHPSFLISLIPVDYMDNVCSIGSIYNFSIFILNQILSVIWRPCSEKEISPML